MELLSGVECDLAVLQLHALYHNVELEKNAEYVAHWLQTQTEIERLFLAGGGGGGSHLATRKNLFRTLIFFRFSLSLLYFLTF
jgi:hypothetical protein